MLALITGASSGFGYHIAKKLVESGYNVIGVARRIDNLNQLHAELGQSFYPLAFDLTDSTEKLKEALAAVPQTFQISHIDLLVNNAGLALGLESADKADLEDWYSMVDTNIKGLISMTHLVLPYMVEKKSGLIINIGSIAGSYPEPYRVCRRVNILRDYPDDKIKIYP